MSDPTPGGDEAFGFALPPFQPAGALQTLARQCRDLGLAEREGAWTLRGQPVLRLQARAADDTGPAALTARLAKRPARSPEWEPAREIHDHAGVRRLADDLKKRLAAWADSRGDER